MRRLVLASALTATSVALGAAACASLDCHDALCTAAQPDGAEAGADSGGPVVPDGCDAAAEPKDAPRCVAESLGVFVDATHGDDTSPGTKAQPVKTIAAGLTRLQGKARLYLCEGTYPEHVTLSTAVSLYGGFACATWAHTAALTKVAPLDPGYALVVRNAPANLDLSDLELAAQPAVTPGESSVAVLVTQTRPGARVTFRRATLKAGSGASGADVLSLAPFSPPNAPDGASGAGMSAGAGAATPNPACTASVGGAGGRDGATSGAAGLPAITPAFPATSTGSGGVFNGGDCSGIARNGSYGAGGSAGAGAATLGVLAADGWRSEKGTAGGQGANGQGGGGGAQVNPTGIGGGGGPGGCGGGPGAPGLGGGASIALALFQADVALLASSLTAADAGRGGNAANGQKAQLTNIHLTQPSAVGDACPGGGGGIGGSGGGGGGGAGGISVGILYTGTAPVLDGASTPAADTLPRVTLGAPGAPGKKGLGGEPARPTPPTAASRAGADGTDGVPGLAKAVLASP